MEAHMPAVTIICDRCGRTINGAIYDTCPGQPSATVGFYNLDGTAWCDHQRAETEHNICDECMWQDPLYIETHCAKPIVRQPRIPVARAKT
jgi:hypothetical protein